MIKGNLHNNFGDDTTLNNYYCHHALKKNVSLIATEIKEVNKDHIAQTVITES